ncbi:MAG: hypothetical protein RI995_1317, partial [Bacteroidota bacterium]
LGSGNGCITKELLANISSDCRLISIELNSNFEQYLKSISDHRFIYKIDSAENLTEILKKLGIIKVDYIISSLPFKIIPDKIEENIYNEIKKISTDDLIFIHYSYFHSQKKKLLKLFQHIKVNFEMMNFPPAFVFVCKNTSKSSR